MSSDKLIKRQIVLIQKLRALGAKSTECIVYDKSTGRISADVQAD